MISIHIRGNNIHIRGNKRARERGAKERGEQERERRERENTTHTGEHGRRVWEESEGGERRGETERLTVIQKSVTPLRGSRYRKV
jgi:hypothetical protein